MKENDKNIDSNRWDKIFSYLLSIITAFLPFFDEAQFDRHVSKRDCGKYILSSWLIGMVCYKYHMYCYVVILKLIDII